MINSHPSSTGHANMTTFLTARNVADTFVAAAGCYSLPPAFTARVAAMETANAMAAAASTHANVLLQLPLQLLQQATPSIDALPMVGSFYDASSQCTIHEL